MIVLNAENRINDHHLSLEEKLAAQKKKGGSQC